ncbi:MAG: GNAT family N-acetyltransferase [Alphaproteobacteria bacterium]|nr:GNAT family N-acetyltransferase [Alphaproteobacteria bacterium]
MTQGYEIVRYTPAYKDAVLRLQTNLWNPDIEVNRAYLDWKYTQNPFDQGHFIHLALAAGEVVGMRGFVGAVWEAEGVIGGTLIPCGGDTVVAREHQSRGLFRHIMAAAEQDLAAAGHRFIVNFSASRVTYFRSVRQGWRPVAPYRSLYRPADRAVASGVAAFDEFGDGEHRIPGHNGKLFLTKTPAVEEMAGLIERIGGDGRIRHVRDQSFLAWRFRNPLSTYRFLLWRGDELEGYLILKRSRYKPGPVIVVDWEAVTPETRSALLDAAVQLCGEHQLDIWSVTLPPEACARLADAGFRPLGDDNNGRYVPSVLVKTTQISSPPDSWTIGNRAVLSDENWDLRMIYSDGA